MSLFTLDTLVRHLKEWQGSVVKAVEPPNAEVYLQNVESFMEMVLDDIADELAQEPVDALYDQLHFAKLLFIRDNPEQVMGFTLELHLDSAVLSLGVKAKNCVFWVGLSDREGQISLTETTAPHLAFHSFILSLLTLLRLSTPEGKLQ